MINAKFEGRKKVICLLNSYTSANTGDGDVRLMGLSGGDVRFIEVFKRLNHLDKIIVTPLVGKRMCEHNNLTGTFITTSSDEELYDLICRLEWSVESPHADDITQKTKRDLIKKGMASSENIDLVYNR